MPLDAAGFTGPPREGAGIELFARRRQCLADILLGLNPGEFDLGDDRQCACAHLALLAVDGWRFKFVQGRGLAVWDECLSLVYSAMAYFWLSWADAATLFGFSDSSVVIYGVGCLADVLAKQVAAELMSRSYYPRGSVVKPGRRHELKFQSCEDGYYVSEAWCGAARIVFGELPESAFVRPPPGFCVTVTATEVSPPNLELQVAKSAASEPATSLAQQSAGLGLIISQLKRAVTAKLAGCRPGDSRDQAHHHTEREREPDLIPA